MRHHSLPRSLKNEEVHVPDTPIIEEFSEPHYRLPAKKENVMDELEDVLDSTEDGESLGHLSWGFMDRDGLSITEEGDAVGHQNFESTGTFFRQEDYHSHFSIKQEECSFLEDDDEKKLSLNLSLNYQGVLEAWSDRTLWADDSSFLSANNAYAGEVPVMEDERRRREASVIRYREKRQSRLFSKKIRYQVRKLNADKRPRLKGRFVRRVPAEKTQK